MMDDIIEKLYERWLDIMKYRYLSFGVKAGLFIALFVMCLVFPMKSWATGSVESPGDLNSPTIGTMGVDYQLNFILRDNSEVPVSFPDLTTPIGLNGTPAATGLFFEIVFYRMVRESRLHSRWEGTSIL